MKRQIASVLLVTSLHLLASPVLAQSALVPVIQSGLAMYSQLRGVNVTEPSERFVGLTVQAREGDFEFQAFHGDSPIDIFAYVYRCDLPASRTACQFVTENPRCFYSSEAGKYSVRDVQWVAEEILNGQALRGLQTKLLKVWQAGDTIFVRSVASRPVDHLEIAEKFYCQRLSQGLRCYSTDEDLPSEI